MGRLPAGVGQAAVQPDHVQKLLVACLAFGLMATVAEQQPEHLRWTAEARGRLAVVAAVT
jgi:hypothetical protein